MVRNNDYFALVDSYLNGELVGADLLNFENELRINPELSAELHLHHEIADAMNEKDVSDLRQSLCELRDQYKTQELPNDIDEEFFFSMADEINGIEELKDSFNDIDEKELDNFLHKVHVSQHRKSLTETVHQLYRKDNEMKYNEEVLSPEDEALFEDIGKAIQERDIMEMRTTLQGIAAYVPTHQYSSEQIDNYLEGDMSPDMVASFEAELADNAGLAKDISLYAEVNDAIGETGVMNLRASLEQIRITESSTARNSEEIEGYLENELSAEMMASFEDELMYNPGLEEEVNLYDEINQAIAESDVMDLRAKLEDIRGIEEQKPKTRGISRFLHVRNSWKVAAACVVVSLALSGTMQYFSYQGTGDLYGEFYSKYQPSGVFRSGSASESVLVKALQKYNEQRYNEALSLFKIVIRQNANDPTGNFYTGMSYQELKQYQKAIYHYDKVIRNQDNLFVEQAQWYMGLCLLQTNDKKRAAYVFGKIAEGDGYYSQKANKILYKIK
ncbi:MAG: hypothetical protein Q8862_05520 [Bacteroidota bacterium]|nr:hypothetical protein [Bacteroidota bacterium]